MLNKKIKKLFKKNQPNSGFTLTELLTGLIMSVIVTGALGFGLFQILTLTRRGAVQSNARNEASRAIEFISDEIRRAQTLEPNAINATGFNPTGRTVVLALNIPELNSPEPVDNTDNSIVDPRMLGSDEDEGTPERVVYYLEASSGNWRGPQVLFRWGPPLNANGQYTQNAWGEEALIDGIDDEAITARPDACDAADTLTPILGTATGFYACINPTSTSAQLFITGGIDTIANNGNDVDDTFTSSTQSVARAKIADVNSEEIRPEDAMSFRSLEADFVCHPRDILDGTDDDYWDVRIDFDKEPYNKDPDDSTKYNIDDATRWVHEEGRQPQPISIPRENPDDLTIYASAVGGTGDCLSTGNTGATVGSDLSTLANNVSFNIKFRASLDGDPSETRGSDLDYWKTFNGDRPLSGDRIYDNPNVFVDNYVNGDEDSIAENEGINDATVIVLKNGSRLEPAEGLTASDLLGDIAPAPLYAGYDPDGDGPAPYRPSLGEFLKAKNYARDNGDGTFTIENLDPQERIVAIEIGQNANGFTSVDKDGNVMPRHPGFDLQDNVTIVRHDIFGEEH